MQYARRAQINYDGDDSVIPSLFNSQDLNRFSYVRNNPLRYTDPTGHMIPADDGGGCYSCPQPPPPCCVDPGTSGGSTGTSGTSTSSGSTSSGSSSGTSNGSTSSSTGGAPLPVLASYQDTSYYQSILGNNGNYDCLAYGSQTTCEVYVSSTSADMLENISDPMAIGAEGLLLTAGTLVGMAGGGLWALAGAVGGFILGSYESEVIHDIQGEFDKAGAGNAPLVITQPDNPNSYGVIVDGDNNGVGVAVNTPLAYITLYLMLKNNKP